MTAERWRRITDVFRAALEEPAHERAAFLEGACGSDEALRRHVEMLLAGEAEPSLPSPLPEFLAGSAIEPASGDMLAQYRVEAKIGAGGMGAVYRAYDTRLQRMVALKVLSPDALADPDRMGWLMREARAASALNHPNIVTIYEIGSDQGMDFIAMEFVSGRTLARLIGRKGLPLRDALKDAVQIASALAAAHGAGILHRDLKPANIMVNDTGQVKVLDFGLAKRTQGSTGEEASSTHRVPETDTGTILGTVAYMSPEQAEGKKLDSRSDIFSFGVVLYEMVTGKRAFERDSIAATLAAILREEPAPVDRGLPEAIERLAMRCLRKDPDRRFQTAADLRAALEDLKDESESGATVPRIVPRRRLRLAIPAVIAATASITAVMIWAPWRRAPAVALAPVQVTFDGGVAATPAMSADGKLFAFASDRAETGNLDIWLRQMTGGTPVRLTSHPALEYNPQFSSDGTQLYYLTGDQEIEEMPALGGPARRVVVTQAGPFTVSTNNEIAYMRRLPAAQLGPMFLMPASGGAPQPWQPECRASSRPVWSADGSELLFFGQCGGDQPGGHLAPRSGGKAVRVCDAASAPVPGVTAGAFPGDLLFPTSRGILRAARDGRVSLTASPVNQAGAVIDAEGNVMFSSSEAATSIWSMTGRLENAAPQEIVTGIGHFGVSRDGSTLVYGRLVSQQGGELVVHNLRSGDERFFAAHELLNAGHGSIWPQVSPDAKQVFYRLAPGNRGGETGHFVLHLDTGEVKKVTGLEEFQLGSDWSADGRRVMGECPPPRFGICDVDPASGAVRKLFVHPSDQLLYPSQSWDGRWMVFGRRKPGGVAGIWVARVTANGIERDDRWAEISSPGTDNSRPRFSADGGFVYYMLGQGGMRKFAIQKIDPRTGVASGPVSLPLRRPIELTALTGGAGPYPLISVTAGAVYYSSMALRGNIWRARNTLGKRRSMKMGSHRRS